MFVTGALKPLVAGSKYGGTQTAVEASGGGMHVDSTLHQAAVEAFGGEEQVVFRRNLSWLEALGGGSQWMKVPWA